MQNLYRKISDRRYEKLNDHEFSGFPSNGIWIVSCNQESFICPSNTFSALKVSLFLKRDILINKLLYSSRTAKESLFDSLIEVVEEIERHSKITSSKILYEKKNVRYKKYGETFRGFPTSGIYEVIDGKNNQIKFLGHFSDYPEIDVDIIKDIQLNPNIHSKSAFEYSGDVLNQVFQEYEKKLQNRG